MSGPDAAEDDPVRERRLPDMGLDGFAPYLINRISARYSADMADALRARGLTTPQMRALAVLAVHPGLTVNQLAVYAVMEQSTMSRTLDTMVECALVERRARADDGRVREIFLTREGLAAFEEVWPLMCQEEARMLEGLSVSDREVLLAVLAKMLRNIRRHPF